jgi:hypothetical protein
MSYPCTYPDLHLYLYRLRIFFSLFLCYTCLTSCTIGRVYQGSRLRQDPQFLETGKEHSQTDILKIFGPPDEILAQKEGYLFVYRYTQTHETLFVLQAVDPVVTQIRLKLFEFQKSNQKYEALVVLFDPQGKVKDFGIEQSLSELTLF